MLPIVLKPRLRPPSTPGGMWKLYAPPGAIQGDMHTFVGRRPDVLIRNWQQNCEAFWREPFHVIAARFVGECCRQHKRVS